MLYTFAELMQQLSHPDVRDLAWACFSPSLIDQLPDSEATPFAPQLTGERFQQLLLLDRHPEPLETKLHNLTSHRLGIRFETLWHFFLEQDPYYNVLATNFPIREHGNTLGELDVLLYCYEHRQVVHLELAIKFFVGIESQTGEVRWPGMTPEDSLQRKCHHMSDHQLRMSTHPCVLNWLEEQGYPEAKRTFAVKGCLFYPADHAIEPPPSVAEHHLRGRWQSVSHFLPSPSSHWYQLPRDQRLAAPMHRYQTPIAEWNELEHEEQYYRGPRMIARERTIEEYVEGQERRLLIPSNWLSHVLKTTFR